MAVVQEGPSVQPSDQGSVQGSDTSSSNGTEEEAIMSVHMQSLSLSALDQQPSVKGEGDLTDAAKDGEKNRGRHCDVRVPTRWRPSLLLL